MRARTVASWGPGVFDDAVEHALEQFRPAVAGASCTVRCDIARVGSGSRDMRFVWSPRGLDSRGILAGPGRCAPRIGGWRMGDWPTRLGLAPGNCGGGIASRYDPVAPAGAGRQDAVICGALDYAERCGCCSVSLAVTTGSWDVWPPSATSTTQHNRSGLLAGLGCPRSPKTEETSLLEVPPVFLDTKLRRM